MGVLKGVLWKGLEVEGGRLRMFWKYVSNCRTLEALLNYDEVFRKA